MHKYGKFGVLVVVIIGTLVWMATAQMGESKTYYKTISELEKMGNQAQVKRLKVAGNVESVVRRGTEVEFTLVEETKKLRVIYNGSEPLPDTFRDGSQALAEGKLGADGVFRAGKIQAKCASKYGSKPGAQPYQAAQPQT